MSEDRAAASHTPPAHNWILQHPAVSGAPCCVQAPCLHESHALITALLSVSISKWRMRRLRTATSCTRPSSRTWTSLRVSLTLKVLEALVETESLGRRFLLYSAIEVTLSFLFFALQILFHVLCRVIVNFKSTRQNSRLNLTFTLLLVYEWENQSDKHHCASPSSYSHSLSMTWLRFVIQNMTSPSFELSPSGVSA